MALLKKAQIQTGETIAVVIIVVFIIVLGIVFYFNFMSGTIDEDRQRASDLDSVSTAIFVSKLNELKCSRAASASFICFDLYRVKAFNESLNEPMIGSVYHSLIGYANATIRTYYPEQGKEYTFYSYEPSNITGERSSFIPVLLSDPVENKKYFAYLEVKVFS